ncbi:uncharacterized protein LOC135170251 [Diachasmimorpha longicaudata]|uniref:uncharacterized protein LOC135170251 n=1 Tax=Diachasmimorpha longicaudata TaxID=58733 RepID=UPI0030B872E3
MRFNVREADWEKFEATLDKEALERLADHPLNLPADVERMAEILGDVLTKACEDSIPRRKHYRRANPWGTVELTSKRKLLERVHYHESNANPWGFHYKYAADTLPVGTVPSTFRTANGATLTVRQTTKVRLDTHVPDDDPNEDTPEHTDIRERGRNLRVQTEDAPDVADNQLNGFVKTLTKDKAPGCDLIEVRVLKADVMTMPNIFTRLFNACLTHGVFPIVWKIGTIRALLKAFHKDVLHRILAVKVLTEEKISGRLYGLLPERSTKDE